MTAAPLAACSGITIEESPLLQERNFGDLRGVPYAELTENPFGPDFVPPNGEDWPRFHAHVAEAFAFIVSRRRAVNGTLVVVTHGLVCRAMVERHALVHEGVFVPDRFDNTSLTGLHEDAPHARPPPATQSAPAAAAGAPSSSNAPSPQAPHAPPPSE